MHIPIINHPCEICALPTSKRCRSCRNAWYCSQEHLEEDWPIHYKTCTSTQTIMDNSLSDGSGNIVVSPSPAKNQRTAVSALLFSPEEEGPRVVSISFLPQCTPSPNTRPRLAISKYFPDEEPEEIIVYNGLNGSPLRYPLHILVSRNAGNKGAPVNRALSNITSSVTIWYGMILVFRFSGTRKLGYTNAGKNDLPNVSTYFIEQHNC